MGAISRSMIRLRMPIFARRKPAMRPVGPAPEIRTGMSMLDDVVASRDGE